MRKLGTNIGLGLLALGGLVAQSANAATVTLTFDDGCNGPCNNENPISQTYGDVAGQADVAYSGNPTELRYWDNGYGNAFGVIYTESGSSASGYGLVTINALAGYQITLNSFKLAAYMADQSSFVKVTDLATSNAFINSLYAIPYSTGYVFTPGVTSSAGFSLMFGPDAYTVGLDTLSFDVTPVPLPAAAWLLLSGLGGVGLFARRRRKDEAAVVPA